MGVFQTKKFRHLGKIQHNGDILAGWGGEYSVLKPTPEKQNKINAKRNSEIKIGK